MSPYFVYMFSRPNGVPCYVGLSCDPGRPAKHLRMAKKHTNKIFANIIAKYGRENLLFEIVKTDLTKEVAISLEIYLIAKYGRRNLRKGPLANLTDGGEGTVGYVPTTEWLIRRKQAAIEFWESADRREAASKRMLGNSFKRGKPNSELQKETARKQMLGNTATLGMRHSPEARLKMKNVWSDPERRVAILEKRHASGMYSFERCQARWVKRKGK